MKSFPANRIFSKTRTCKFLEQMLQPQNPRVIFKSLIVILILLLSRTSLPINATNEQKAIFSQLPATWDIHTIDSSSGGRPFLSLDASGSPHISYVAEGVKYAYWTGDAWEVQNVGGDQYAHFPSLILDDHDSPHISYYDATNQAIKYAQQNGNIWDVQTVDSGFEGRGTSLALDSAGNAHIAYCARPAGNPIVIRYTHWADDKWIVHTLDRGWGASLVLDDQDYPHIAYVNGETLAVMYAQWTGSEWDVQTVDASGGNSVSLILDDATHPHLSYANWDLKYAYWTGATWELQTVLDDDRRVRYTAMILDNFGFPHISYSAVQEYESTFHSDLEYASWTGESWHIQAVVSDENDGEYWGHSSLTLDRLGFPHISYSGSQFIKYAKLMPKISLNMQATPSHNLYNLDTLTYTLSISGTSPNTYLWNPFPDALVYVSHSLTTLIPPAAVYNPINKTLTWEGALMTNTIQTITFQATLEITNTGIQSLSPPIVNTAWLTDTYGRNLSATVIVNARYIYLPTLLSR